MTRNTISRRDALRGIAGATITGMAGCLSGVPGVQGSGGSAYMDWLYEPGTFGDNDHYSFQVAHPGDVVEYEDELSSEAVETFEELVEDRYEILDLDIDDVNQIIMTGSSHVFTGSFDVEDIDDELSDEDYDDDEYEGYDVYVSPEERQAFGIKSDVVVQASEARSDDAEDVLEESIDTKLGETDRYVDESEAFRELVDQLQTGVYMSGGTHEEYDETAVESGQLENEVASGLSVRITGEDSKLQSVHVFEEADDIVIDDVEDVADEIENWAYFEDVDDIEISKAGRAAIISGTLETDEIFS